MKEFAPAFSDHEQAAEFRSAVRATVSQPGNRVRGTVLRDPTTGTGYVKRVFYGVPIPFEFAQQAVYMDDERTVQVPNSADVATVFPLRGDAETQPMLKVAWEFDPTADVRYDGDNFNAYLEAAKRRGHVSNMWREVPDGSTIQPATAFKAQVTSRELAQYGNLTSSEQMAIITEQLSIREIASQQQAWTEAELLDTRTTHDEGQVVIDFVRSLQ